jgi:cytochrome c peroxidase
MRPFPPGVQVVRKVVRCEHVRATSVLAAITATFPIDELHAVLGPESFSPTLEGASLASTGSEIQALRADTEVGHLAKDLILIGTENAVADATDLIHQLDRHRDQVRLHMKISDISFDGLRQLGIAYDFSPYTLTETTGAAAASGTPATIINKLGLGQLAHLPISITATVSALEQRNQAKTLAEPTISLLDGEHGFILIGDRILYPKLTGYTQAQTPIYSQEEVRVGIYVQVAVQMSEHGDLVLSVYPQVSTITGYLTIDGADYPQISTREQQTTVRLKADETLVIGGLISDQEVKDLQQIPFLGQIPGLGELFRSRNHTTTKEDLVIMITPEILHDDDGAASAHGDHHGDPHGDPHGDHHGEAYSSLRIARPTFPATPPPAPLGLPELKWPEANPYSAAKAELGWLLFFDKRFSSDETIACASCHAPGAAFTDGRERPLGVKGEPGRRNSPTIINAAYSPALTWDGRVASLEDQAKLALTNPVEMDMDPAKVVRTIQSIPEYRTRFRAVFGRAAPTIDELVQAIATFERLVVSGNSPYDRFMAGEKTALTASQQRGLATFTAKCATCHPPPLFTNRQYVRLGVGRPGLDSGRLEVTGREEDRNAFRVPSLREVTLTAPYMHDGSYQDIESVLHLYLMGSAFSMGMDKRADAVRLLAPEFPDLKDFLGALNGEGWQRYRAP